jgi:hypothetical protein
MAAYEPEDAGLRHDAASVGTLKVALINAATVTNGDITPKGMNRVLAAFASSLADTAGLAFCIHGRTTVAAEATPDIIRMTANIADGSTMLFFGV